MPAAISNAAPRDHCKFQPASREPEFVPRSSTRTAESSCVCHPTPRDSRKTGVLVAGGPRLCHPPPGPCGIPAVRGFKPTAPGCPAPQQRRSCWFGFSPRALTRRIRIIAQPDRLSRCNVKHLQHPTDAGKVDAELISITPRLLDGGCMEKRLGKAGGKGKWRGTTQPPSPSPSGPGSYVFWAITGPFWNHCRTPSRHRTRSEQHRWRERSGPCPMRPGMGFMMPEPRECRL